MTPRDPRPAGVGGGATLSCRCRRCAAQGADVVVAQGAEDVRRPCGCHARNSRRLRPTGRRSTRAAWRDRRPPTATTPSTRGSRSRAHAPSAAARSRRSSGPPRRFPSAHASPRADSGRHPVATAAISASDPSRQAQRQARQGGRSCGRGSSGKPPSCSRECSHQAAIAPVRGSSQEFAGFGDLRERTGANGCEPGAETWGSRGRRFKSCQPDSKAADQRVGLILSSALCRVRGA